MTVEHRAERLLTLMREPERAVQCGETWEPPTYAAHPDYQYGRDYQADSEWFWICRVPYIGRKTIDYLKKLRLIEVRAVRNGLQGRVIGDADLGDLWVE